MARILKNLFKHLLMINIHKFYVCLYCFKAGIFWRGIKHDISKFHPIEFFESIKNSETNHALDYRIISYINRHISDENIPNLRKFIETMSAKELTNLRNILLGILKHMSWFVVWSTHLHGAEFMELEKLFIFTHSLLCKKNWAWVINIYCDSKNQENRRKDDKSTEGH